MSSATVTRTLSGLRLAAARSASRQAVVGQQRRVDAVGQLAQLLDGQLHVVGQLAEHLAGPVRVFGHDVAGQAQVDGQRHQVLLGAVVQVAFDPAAFGVPAGDDAGPRFAQLVRLLAQRVQRGLQRGVELGVVEGQADLAGQLGQHAVVLLGEGVARGRPAPPR